MELPIYNGFYYRPDTVDLYVLKHIHIDYKGLVFSLNDVVLDIGGHIGSFVGHCSPHVEKVVTVEPHPDNFALNKANTGDFNNVERINAAAVPGRGTGKARLHHFTPGKRHSNNTGSHSLYGSVMRKHSIEIDTIGFDDLLDRVKPSIIKMDCEGAEYDLLKTPLPACVKQIALELHISRKDMREVQRPRLLDSLHRQGFRTKHLTKAKKVPIGQQGVFVR